MGAVPQSVWAMSSDGSVTLLVGGGITEQRWHPDGGTSWKVAVHPKDRGWVRRAWRRATRERSTLDAVVRVRLDGAPGRFRHIKINAAPVPGEDGGAE
nr:diguanylate cyclase [Streptomyces sp. DSM 41633]